MMILTDDMVEFLGLIYKYGVEFVLVGGHAVNYYGYVRTTQDIDLLIYPSSNNAQRMMAALGDFGFGDAGIPASLFETTGSAIHLGNEPNRIDLLTTLKGTSKRVMPWSRLYEFHSGDRSRPLVEGEGFGAASGFGFDFC